MAKDAAHTQVADIVVASEESIEMTRCGKKDHGGCMAAGSRCLTHDLWEGLTNHIYDYLRSVTLADICNRNVPKLPEASFVQPLPQRVSL